MCDGRVSRSHVVIYCVSCNCFREQRVFLARRIVTAPSTRLSFNFDASSVCLSAQKQILKWIAWNERNIVSRSVIRMEAPVTAATRISHFASSVIHNDKTYGQLNFFSFIRCAFARYRNTEDTKCITNNLYLILKATDGMTAAWSGTRNAYQRNGRRKWSTRCARNNSLQILFIYCWKKGRLMQILFSSHVGFMHNFFPFFFARGICSPLFVVRLGWLLQCDTGAWDNNSIWKIEERQWYLCVATT